MLNSNSPNPKDWDLKEKVKVVQQSLAPAGRPLWCGVLTGASLIFSLGVACAVPLAAFAAIGALTLTRRGALALISAVWLVNQIAGFGILHYPLAADTFAWGLALGAVAVLATFAALWVRDRSQRLGAVAAPAVFLAAFAVYEGSLLAISAVSGSGLSDYSLFIAGRIFAINATSFAALFILNRLGVHASLSRTRQTGVPA